MTPSRRSVLAAGATIIGCGRKGKLHACVIGAGAFGGWTALHLLRQGARVTLLDAWGPGNSRASSGGETRILRATYGPHPIYVQMVVRSLALWREHEKRWNQRLYTRIGCIWMPGKDDQHEKASIPIMREAGLSVDELSAAEASKRWPQINFDGVSWVIHEHEAGYLTARRNCQLVLAALQKEGGTYRQIGASPGTVPSGSMQRLSLSDDSTIEADAYVFACGPWLGKLFPEVFGKRIQPSRQEVFFFGTASGDPRFLEGQMPAWIDAGAREFYGIPGNEWRGFKLADDARGGAFDPTSGDRMATQEGSRAARAYMEYRFPAMRAAPLLETRVCQYENSPDTHYILDRHPTARNVWLAGGGSGHGYKMGPAIGEYMAALVLGRREVNSFFSLNRFSQ